MKTVIFDFDGTIVDSLAAVIKVFEEITKHPRRLTPQEIERLQHKDLLQISLELGIPKWKIPWLIFRGRRMFKRHMRTVKIHPGMAELIMELHDKTIPMYVLSSNSKANVEQYLQWHKLDQYFLQIYGGAGLLGKARRLRKLTKKHSVDAKDCWYIGDERRDIIGARAAGIPVIAVSWGFNSKESLREMKPEKLVDSPSQIAAILQV